MIKMTNGFKYLSLKEENQLSVTELEAYYKQLKEYLQSRELKTTTKGATTVAPRLKKYVNKLYRSVTKLFAEKGMEMIVDGVENIPEGAVVFASTHQGILDNLCWIPDNPKHAIMLHASDLSKILIWVQMCTGMVLVNKNYPDPESRKNAKLDMIKILMEGHSLWYFPEGAWNLSPNKLFLPLSFGFLDVAKKSGTPVVPVVIEYTYDTSTEKEKVTKIHIRYGKPIYVSLTDDLNEKLLEYEESIATIRWELFEEKGLFKRKDITNWDYINYLKGCYSNLAMKNFKLGRKLIEIERNSIRGAKDDFYLFHHINDVAFNEQGELLETEETIRLNRIIERNIPISRRKSRIVCPQNKPRFCLIRD